MKFTKVKPIPSKVGDKRTINKFAWLPTVIGIENELIEIKVWLEFYIQEEEYRNRCWIPWYSFTSRWGCWTAIGRHAK